LTCASVITKNMTSVPGGYDYYTGQMASPHWSQPEEGMQTRQHLATGFLQQLLHRVPRLPKTDRWISCTVQIR
jgi:hypothetical protein